MSDPDLTCQLVQKLESLRRAGVTSIPRPVIKPRQTAVREQSVHPGKVAKAASPSVSPQTATHSATQTAPPAAPATSKGGSLFGHSEEGFTSAVMPPADRGPALEVLAGEVSQCTRCSELADKRTQTVFGVGDPNARLVFFGEAPGADEDRQGEPFVGKAGQLLTKIIEACTLKREDVYIMNVLKCRPPGNRNPTPGEVTNCRPFFERQLEVIRPEMIVCLGSIAATTLLQTTMSVGRMRGKFHRYRGIPVAVTYHPAYLLRNPDAKKLTWADMKMVMKELGIAL